MTLYYLKIIEGFSMDVQFDSVQGLNLFHKKTQSLVNSIDGVSLTRHTIHVERTLDVIPLLYLKDGAPFTQYKYILFNHIQSIINFYALRNWDPVLCPDSKTTTCQFEGGKDKLDIDDFLDSRKNHTLQDLQEQLPIRASINFPNPSHIFWHRFYESPLWENYLQLRSILHDCNGSLIDKEILPFHAQVLNFKSFEKVHYFSLTEMVKEKLKKELCCSKCRLNCFPIYPSFF